MTIKASWKPMMTAAILAFGAQTATAQSFLPAPEAASYWSVAADFDIYATGAQPGQFNFMKKRFALKSQTTAPGPAVRQIRLTGTSSAAKLRSLIAIAEAGSAGYDAVQLGARVKPPKKPTQMTLAEILDWIRATPGQQHAIGRYQIIPATLKSLMRQSGINPDTRFSREVQDAMADVLLLDAGYDRFACGRMSRHDFMEKLARIWAGLPTASGASA